MYSVHSFGDWLKRRRQALGLTQHDLAQRVGCAVATIRKLETDERRPSMQVAEHLADQLAIAPHERTAFLRCARADLAVTHLPPPSQFAAAMPHGTVTLLLTDITGSAEWRAQPPDALQHLRTQHAAMLRQTITTYNGHIFRSSGDTLYAVFAVPIDALAAAVEAQRTIQHAARSTAIRPHLRMALHTGAAAEQASDYAGPVLNRAIALLAVADSGQIMLSGATAELVRDELPSETELRDLGTHRLGDTKRPAQVFQLLGNGLSSALPNLATLADLPTNLPAAPTPLIGRRRDVATLRQMLRGGDVRLITLTGPGGIGKTRLGIAVAADLLDAFPDGVYFVDLAAAYDSSRVIAAIAAILGVRDDGSGALFAHVQQHARTKRLLLVLDNFEQVLSAAPLVSDLLKSAPYLNVLVTSRAPLHLSGEYEFPVPPLALPDRHLLPTLDTLSQYEAVALFIARSRAVKPDWTISNTSAPMVAEICYRLDGLPLAIELAAARSKLFQPADLLAQLGRPLHLLIGGARDLPLRQQALRNTIAWSYDLLPPHEQTLFCRLAVFAGGCTLAAATAVCEPGDRATIRDDLAALVDQSMLRHDNSVDDESRFWLLHTIREAALERLETSGEADTIRQRHAAYYLDLASSAEVHLNGAEQTIWLDRLEREHDNLRAALQWAVERREAETALRLAGSVWCLWDMHAHFTEGRRWFELVLALPSAETTPVARLKVLNGAATLARRQSEYDRAAALFEAGLALSRAADEHFWTSVLLNGLGLLLQRQGDYDRATALFEESLALSRAIGNEGGVAAALGNLGSILRKQGDLVRAAQIQEECLALSRELGDQRGIAADLNNLAVVLDAQGDLERATVLQQESLELYRCVGDRYGVALLLYNLGARLLHMNQMPQARANLRESMTTYQELGEAIGCIECLEQLAAIAITQSRSAVAAQLLAAAECQRIALGSPCAPSEQAEVDHMVAAIRRQLSTSQFTAAWAQGAALTLEQAQALARGDERST